MENLFVYGTLMGDANHPLGIMIRQEGRFLGRASFKGKLFSIDYYPGAVLSSLGSNYVSGEVYALSNNKDILISLDEYEEYHQNDEKNSEFVRRKINVKLENGAKISAWTYLYNFPTNGLKEIPSGDFRGYLQDVATH